MSRALKASQRQERRVANRFGGRTTPGSGNTWARKNDVRTPDLSFEMKYTGKSQFALKASELEQGERHALADGRDFAFGIEMNGRNWIVISEDDFETLRNALDEVTSPEPETSVTIWPENEVVLQILGHPAQHLNKGDTLTITPGQVTSDAAN